MLIHKQHLDTAQHGKKKKGNKKANKNIDKNFPFVLKT